MHMQTMIKSTAKNVDTPSATDELCEPELPPESQKYYVFKD